MKWLNFWPSQKIKICISSDLENYLGSKKFKVLALQRNLLANP